jgi:hypothetical protein
MQEQWGHGSFHPGFKGNPGSQARCNKVRVLVRSSGRARCKATKVKFKLQWKPQGVGNIQKHGMSTKESHRRGRSQLREAKWTSKSKGMWCGCPGQVEFTSQHHIPQMLDTQLQDLIFALLGVFLTLVPFLLSVAPFLPVGLEVLALCHVSWKYVTLFRFYGSSQLRGCLESW